MQHRAHRIAAAVAAVAATLLALAPGAGASPSQESMLMDDAKLVYGDSAQVDATLSTARALGVDRLRVSVFWRLVAPSSDSTTKPSFDASNPRAYPLGAWNRYDRIALAAQKHGLTLLFSITGPGPVWASSNPALGQRMLEPNPSDFGRFVTAVGRRYAGDFVTTRLRSKGDTRITLPPILDPPPPNPGPAPPPAPGQTLPRVDTWSIWNEPNQPGWLRPQITGRVPTSPRLYRALQDAGYSGLQASGHGGDTYLLAETAPRGAPRTVRNLPMRPLLFIRELYCLNKRLRPYRGQAAAKRGCPTSAAERAHFVADHPGLFEATGFAHHPYAFDVFPWIRDQNQDQVTISTLGRLTRTLDRALRRWGVPRRLPIYLTEYGYQTDPPDTVIGVSWRRQAAFINYGDDIAYRNPRVRSVAQFLLYDDGPNPKVPPSSYYYWGSTFQTGLLTVAGARKPSFAAYQRPLNVSPRRPRRGQRLRIFGQLRPAAPGAALVARVQFRRRGSSRWRTLRNVNVHSFRNYVVVRLKARRSGSWRVAWNNPSGGTRLLSRTAYVGVR
jgi:hypothetical protein